MSSGTFNFPAFPVPVDRADPDYMGMSLRDYFAAKAMAAMIDGSWRPDGHERQQIAQRAYAMADAMIKAREA